jgi:hypothetical protein
VRGDKVICSVSLIYISSIITLTTIKKHTDFIMGDQQDI